MAGPFRANEPLVFFLPALTMASVDLGSGVVTYVPQVIPAVKSYLTITDPNGTMYEESLDSWPQAGITMELLQNIHGYFGIKITVPTGLYFSGVWVAYLSMIVGGTAPAVWDSQKWGGSYETLCTEMAALDLTPIATSLTDIKTETDKIGTTTSLTTDLANIALAVGSPSGVSIKTLIGNPVWGGSLALDIDHSLGYLLGISTTLGTPAVGHTVVGDLATVSNQVSTMSSDVSATKDNTTAIKATSLNSVYFDAATSRLNLYDELGTTIFAYWLCYQEDGVTLATTIAQVAKRGPVVVVGP